MDDTAMGQPGPGADEDHEDKGDRAEQQASRDSGTADNPLEAASEGLEEGLERQGEGEDGTGG